MTYELPERPLNPPDYIEQDDEYEMTEAQKWAVRHYLKSFGGLTFDEIIDDLLYGYGQSCVAHEEFASMNCEDLGMKLSELADSFENYAEQRCEEEYQAYWFDDAKNESLGMLMKLGVRK